MQAFHRGLLLACLLAGLLPRPAAAQFTSRYPYVAVAANFNGYNTYDANMTLISNGVWQGFYQFQSYTNPTFLFATRDFTNVWKEVGQSDFDPPISGTAETGGSGNDIVVTGAFSGTLRLTLNENNNAFTVENVTAGQSAGDVWINEFHYDNEGTDSNEFLEVAGLAGVNLTNYAFHLYRSNGTVYSNLVLSTTITNQQNGFGAVRFLSAGIQNGPNVGIALVRLSPPTVLQFISYEGFMVATSGPASGMTSVDIGVEESGGTQYTQSLQLVGSGATYSNFTWVGYTNASPGQLNEGQTTVTGSPPAFIIISNLVRTPSSAGTGDTVHVDVDITPFQGVTNLHATLFYRINSNGLYQPLPMSRTGTHHRTINPIPANSQGGTVEYYVFATFTGFGTNSPTLYPTTAPTQTFQYGVSRVPPGLVWINEINAADGFFGAYPDGSTTNEYIELAGKAGFNISGWRIDIYSAPASVQESYAAPPGKVLPNDTSGYGFYVFGDQAVQNVDQVFSNTANDNLPIPGGVRLYNEFGELQYSLSWNTSGDTNWSEAGFALTGTDDDFLNDGSLMLVGSGSNYNNFGWDFDSGAPYSPGAINDAQTLTGGNTNPLAPILICPSNVELTCANAVIPTANVASVTATGLCGSGSVTVSHVSDTTNSGTGCFGSPKIITRTYRAVSTCATTSECVQTITLEDKTPPALTCSTTTLVNAGFEFGDFTGWTTYGGVFTNLGVGSIQPHSGFSHALVRGSSSTRMIDSANGLDGLYFNNPARVQAGATTGTGFSVLFNGSNQYAETPYTPFLNGQSFSLTAWVRPTSMTNRRVVVASRDFSISTVAGYYLQASESNRWQFNTGDGDSWDVLTSPSSVTSNAWVHLAATLAYTPGTNPSALKQLWINGALSAQQVVTGYVPNTVNPLRVAAGATEDQAADYFRGYLDDVHIFDLALSTGEVAQLYNAGAGGTEHGDEIARYRMDEAAVSGVSTSGFYQGLAAVSGQTWTATAFAFIPSTDPLKGSNAFSLLLLYLNSTGGILRTAESSVLTASSPTNTYIRLAASAVAPSNTASARFVASFRQDTNASNGTVYLDDAVLSTLLFQSATGCPVMTDLRSLVSASDVCGAVTVTQNPPSNTVLSVSNTLVTFTATDGCGLSSVCSLPIAVIDTTPPTLACAASITSTCYTAVPAPNPGALSATDNCGPATVTWEGDTTNSGTGCASSPMIISRTYRATDSAGNSTSCVQTIVVRDTAAPSVAATPPAALTNPGFETTTPLLLGWNRFGANVFAETFVPKTSFRHAKMFGNFSGPGENHTGIYQDRTARSGQVWRASIFMLTPTNDFLQGENRVELKLEFLGPFGFLATFVSPTFTTNTPRGVYLPFAVSGTAPADTTIARITVAFVQKDDAAGSIYLDDASLSMNLLSIATNSCTAALPDLTRMYLFADCSPTVTVSQTVAQGTTITAATTRLVNFRAVDACGNTNSSQTVTVFALDDTAPTILSGPANATVASTNDIPPADTNSVTATDNCGVNIVMFPTNAYDVVVSTNPTIVVRRTYAAVDTGTNYAFHVQYFTVSNAVPDAPTNVAVVGMSLGTNIVVRSLGTNTWGVSAEYTTNLPIQPQTWLPMAAVTNNFAGGTNVTSFNPPVTSTAPVIIRIRQHYP